MGRRRVSEKPFMDIRGDERAFSIPRRKWRELLFIGVLVPDGDDYIRDPSRRLPPFRVQGLFPPGARFKVEEEADRVVLRRVR